MQGRQTGLFDFGVDLFPGDGKGRKQHDFRAFIGRCRLYGKSRTVAVIGCKWASYCRILYARPGTYEAVAKTTQLDRRTVKKHIERKE
ncbi:MAG: hypothetical protein A2X81_08165 [Desulfobacterales bacterium GWB2_56_26]|nr:MAG: hypothetical protein A2X81_08165 [Desulfobacterales bacterium GWB2_56_26]